MPKYKAPSGHTGVNIAGAQFNVDADGTLTVPDGNYQSLLEPLGYVLQADQPLNEVIKTEPETPPQQVV